MTDERTEGDPSAWLHEDDDKGKTPEQKLQELATRCHYDIFSPEFAAWLDEHDPLRHFRDKFCYPKMKDLKSTDVNLVDPEDDSLYFCGHSLGLKPRKADEYMKEQLDLWAKCAVQMHMIGRFPAATCDLFGRKATARLIGANSETEVALLNGLTVNLQLLMTAFYKPTKTRFKIIMEAGAFPSDRYAAASQAVLHGFSPDEAIVEVKPKPGKFILRTEDILQIIEEQGDEIALILFSGVQYFTGQKFNMELITAAGKRHGCIVGWDLAHAIGNVKLKLHEWNVDFAAWCSYKYLNSGAGGLGGIFVHSHHSSSQPQNLHGWWSNKHSTRFEMRKELDPADGAQVFAISNPPPWLAVLNMASLEVFDQTNMEALIRKQRLLTGYLELLLDGGFAGQPVEILTPRDPRERGCQLSISVHTTDAKTLHDELEKRGVVCDVRPPGVLRVTPIPLYNRYSDVRRLVDVLKNVLNDVCLHSEITSKVQELYFEKINQNYTVPSFYPTSGMEKKHVD